MYELFDGIKTQLLNTFFILLTLAGNAQVISLETSLNTELSETSGLLYLNSKLITHNDSGNPNELYEINTATGEIDRTVTIGNATNVDWEDIAADDTHIYIADIGNNNGNRTDLKIYKILISDYETNTNVTAEVINYNYEDQTDFTASPFTTDFDAEALIVLNGNLYIFTKNWNSDTTNIYQLPSTPGTYSISKIDTFNSNGLITGATTDDNDILLTGYDEEGPFIIVLSGFSGGLFSNGSNSKFPLTIPANYSPQIEGITNYNSNLYYISAEESFGSQEALYTLDTSSILDIDSKKKIEFNIWPNPVSKDLKITVEGGMIHMLSVYSTEGKLIQKNSTKELNINNIQAGIYFITLKLVGGEVYVKKLVIR